MEDSEIGKIKSLMLRDFLTYDELKYIPGSHLNIIIGPNGTGKSTIVAGIILGCGGKPALLSRSKSIADFVKNGKHLAKIEVVIITRQSNRPIHFQREFDKDAKESYKIDGKSVSGKEYCKQIAKFNIQVDNLCMFLPQDRVQDFTKMNPQELLANTQQSVCSAEINDIFKRLLEIREKQKTNSKTNSELQKRLDENNNRNHNLKQQIDSNKRKDDMIEKVNLYKSKKVWKEYENLQVEFNDVDKDMKLMTKKLNDKTSQLKPLEDEQKKQAGDKTALRNEISKSNTSLSENCNQLQQLQDAANEVESSFNRTKQNLLNTIQSAKDHKKSIEDTNLLIKKCQTDLTNAEKEAQEQGDINGEMQKCDQEINVVKNSIEKLLYKRQVIQQNIEEQIIPSIRNCQRKLQTLSDTQRQSAESLRNLSEDAYRAYSWINNNRNRFRGKIYNPIIELTMKDKKFAKYIENTVGLRDLQSFICTDKEDSKKLFQILRTEQGLMVNIATVEDNDHVIFEPPKDISEYPEELGLYGFLIDVIDGPAPVINHLCKLYQIQKVLIGDDRTYKNASQVPDDIRLFFSTNHRFNTIISKYSGLKSQNSNEIQPRNIMNVGIDENAKTHLNNNLAKWQQELEQKRNDTEALQREISNREATISEIKATKLKFQKYIQNIQTAKDKLRRKQSELERLMSSNIDVNEEKKKFKAVVDSLSQKKLQICEKQIAKLIEFKDNSMRKVLANKKVRLFDELTGNVDEKINELKREIENTQRIFQSVKSRHDYIKQKLNMKKVEALQLTNGIDPTSSRYKYKNEFLALTSELGELQNQIDDLQGRIECIPGIDPSIIHEYEDRLKEIEEIEKQIVNDMNNLHSLEATLKDLHERWYPQITNVIQIIDKNFAEFFKKMGFVGEIELIKKEERDYADYGIQIRVQYRDNEKLQVLNRHVQSGGERAVAIAVYTLSLQHLTHVPFRCVDEINQGMDPKNERKIFQMLVDITCKEGQSQYFFVTPKLLQDLPCHELMSVSVVHNGEFIEDPYMFVDKRREPVVEEAIDFDTDSD